MSRCDLNLWPVDLQSSWYIKRHVIKVCTKFEQNRIIHDWVIDDLARLRRAILGGGAFLPNGSQGCVDPTSPNLARAYTAIILHKKFVSEFGYLAVSSKDFSTTVAESSDNFAAVPVRYTHYYTVYTIWSCCRSFYSVWKG